MIRTALAAFAFGLLVPACPKSTTTTAPAESEPTLEAATTVLIERATELSRAGKWQRAIDEGLDPAIALYEAEYDDAAVQYRATRGSGVANALTTLLSSATTPGADGNVQQTILLSSPFWPDLYFFKAFALSELGRLDEARTTLLRAMVLLPNDVLYLNEFGDQAHKARNWTEALDAFTQAKAQADLLAADPDGASRTPFGTPPQQWQTRALRGIGFSLVELHRLDDAEAAYREVLAIDANDAQAQRELALIATLRVEGAR